ncbi:hypothetical protein N9848_03895 [Flavobacteriaceae bacterium]|jgi:hypothetical protein|nr:hypothetical protein [Flavobacteriaceae bacterium]|tara:strand:- start:334 stop:495 length:162 start_codon:yes stop_codon:yes gene_type:complete
MKNELEKLNIEQFIVDCDENYNEVFAETIDLVNSWKNLYETKKRYSLYTPTSI